MKILFFSDPHFHAFKSHSEIKDGINSRLTDIGGTVRQAYEIGHECDLCIVTGDIFHVRGNVKPSTQNFVADLFEKLAVEIPTIILGGNHDMEDYNSGEMSINMMNYIPDIEVINTPQVFDWSDSKIIAIPYIHKTDDFKAKFEEFSAGADESTITVIHQGIDNFTPHSGMPETQITASYLLDKNPGHIFCGHYHFPEVSGRLINCGAICQHNFGDIGDKRGCWIFDTKEESATFHRLNNYAPVFIDFDPDLDPKSYENNFVRIRAKNKTQAHDMSRAAIKANARSITVQIIKEFKTAHDKAISIDKPFKMLKSYIGMQKKLKPHKAEILKLYKEICLE